MKPQDRTCAQCKRILQQSIHDKCMFCGEPIPEIFQLSEVKKEEIRNKIDERQKRQQNEKRIRDKKSKSSEGSCGSMGGCGSCGGSCGGA